MDTKRNYLAYIIIAVPVIFYFYNVVRYSVDIPYMDDYDAVLNSLIIFKNSPGPLDRMNAVFMQHNEHKIAVVRAVAFITYYTTGSINFRLLIILGNLSLIGLLIVLWKAHKRDGNGALYFAPAAFILFAPQYWETIEWAMASMSNLYVLFFAVLSLYALCNLEGPGPFIVAALSAVLALYSQGSGISALVIGAGVLAYRKRYGSLAAWLAVAGASLAFYFYGYVKPAHHPSIVKAIVETPLRTADYFFSFIGSAFFVHGLAGMIIVLFFAYLTWKRYFDRNMAVYSCLLFLLMAALLAALTRSGFGVDQALSSRYRIISVLIMAFCYLAAMEVAPRARVKSLFAIVMALAFLYNVGTNLQYLRNLSHQKRELREGVERWRKEGAGLAYPDAAHANDVMSKSISMKIYEPR